MACKIKIRRMLYASDCRVSICFTNKKCITIIISFIYSSAIMNIMCTCVINIVYFLIRCFSKLTGLFLFYYEYFLNTIKLIFFDFHIIIGCMSLILKQMYIHFRKNVGREEKRGPLPFWSSACIATIVSRVERPRCD